MVCLSWITADHTPPHVLIHGGNTGTYRSDGIDTIAERIATEWGWEIIKVDADWDRYGREAGPRRNREMVALNPETCLAFPIIGANNQGTLGCLELAWRAGVPTCIFPLRHEEY
jgi:hypothetical protein